MAPAASAGTPASPAFDVHAGGGGCGGPWGLRGETPTEASGGG